MLLREYLIGDEPVSREENFCQMGYNADCQVSCNLDRKMEDMITTSATVSDRPIFDKRTMLKYMNQSPVPLLMSALFGTKQTPPTVSLKTLNLQKFPTFCALKVQYPVSSLLLNPVYNHLNQVHIFVLTTPECKKFCTCHSRFKSDNIYTKFYLNQVDCPDIKPAVQARTLFRFPTRLSHSSTVATLPARMSTLCSVYEMIQR